MQQALSKKFEAEALARLKAGESLTGKGRILTPLIKQMIEASLEGELDAQNTRKMVSAIAQLGFNRFSVQIFFDGLLKLSLH